MLFNWGNKPNISESGPYLEEKKVPDSAKDPGECPQEGISWERVLEVFHSLFISGATSTAPVSIGTF